MPYIPPPPAHNTTPALSPASRLLRLCPPCQPQSASCPAPRHPSPGLLSCRMMARKKSWENMALVPSPSCLHPPSSQPLQPSQLGSQPGAGLQRKAHPTPFSPGQSACQARSSSVWSSLGRGQGHHVRGPPWGEEGGCSHDPSPSYSHLFFLLLAPLPQSRISMPPYPTVVTSVPQSSPVLGTQGGSAPLGNRPATWGPASLELSAQSGCGFKALRAASPPQNLPKSLSLRLGLEGLGPSKLGAELGASQYQPPHLPGTS